MDLRPPPRYAVFPAQPPGYGLLPLIALVPLIAAGIGASGGIAAAAINKSGQKQAALAAQSQSNPCVAQIRGQIATLERDKPAGWRDRRKALERDLAVHIADPYRCTAFQPSAPAAPVMASMPPQFQTQTPPPPPPAADNTPLYVAGGVVAVAAVAAILLASSKD